MPKWHFQIRDIRYITNEQTNKFVSTTPNLMYLIIQLERKDMIISDLNYLEQAEANVEGGYNFGHSSVTVVKETLLIFKNLKSNVDVSGNFAGAEAEAAAYGDNSSTQALTFTVTYDDFSGSSATSTSATD